MLKFAITGVAGYVAPRHLRAIKDCGGVIVAAYDPHDSVGILDSYNRECFFSKEWKEFYKRCLFEQPDYLVICSPNYHHYEQAIAGLRIHADVICEKPVVLTTADVKRLQDCEKETKRKVNTILQLRLKPELQALRERVTQGHKVFLRYHTPRGPWYKTTWKNNTRMSGGLATNVGIHMFDLLLWIFGTTFKRIDLVEKTEDRVVGSFETQTASIDFDLSIESFNGVSRELYIDDEKIDFTGGFTDLHTHSYREILAGRGFGLDVSKPSIALCEKIRKS